MINVCLVRVFDGICFSVTVISVCVVQVFDVTCHL